MGSLVRMVSLILLLVLSCAGARDMAYYEGNRPTSDAGPNTGSGAPAGDHWVALDDGSNPRLNPGSGPGSLEALRIDASGEEERVRLGAKPQSVDVCSKVILFVIQQTDGSFNAASGFMEFPITLYKADNTTVLGTTTAHVANVYDPTLPEPGANGPFWEVQAYEFAGLSLTQADIDAGLIVGFSGNAADGWGGGGGTWWLFAAWTGYEYTLSQTVVATIEGDSRVREVISGRSPIASITGEAKITETIEGTSIIDVEV